MMGLLLTILCTYLVKVNGADAGKIGGACNNASRRRRILDPAVECSEDGVTC